MNDTKQLRELLAAGTRGPVFYEHRGTKRDIEKGDDFWAVIAESDRGDIDATYFARAKSEADAALIVAAVNALPGLLDEVKRLRGALGWFLADERFQVAVGGNPDVVERMLADALAALEGKGS